jgi:O-antigen/teichoic acid export membrane protein
LNLDQENLKRSVVIGAAWVSALRFTDRIIGIVSTILLARLLTPNDFGIIAIAMSLYALIELFSKFGFETVLIQKENPGREDYDTAWSLNFIFGILSALLLLTITPKLASFYELPELLLIVPTISLLFILKGIKNIGVVDFQKNLTFDKEFKLQIIPKLISFVVTIICAVYFRDYRALIIGNLTWMTVITIFSYHMHPYRPKFSVSKTAELFKFSKWLLINNVFHYVNVKSPELILGKILSPHAAAIYTLSSEIGSMATQEVIANLNRAIYPGYAKVAKHRDRLMDLYKSSMSWITTISLPLGVGVLVVDDYLISVLLGEQWVEAIDLVGLIAIASSLFSLTSNSNVIYLALGRPKLTTFVAMIRSIIFISSLFIMIDMFGIVGAAYSFLFTSCIMLFVSTILIKVVLNLPFKQMLGIYFRPFVATIVMYFITVNIDSFFDVIIYVKLITLIVVGIVSYCLSLILLWFSFGKPTGPEQTVYDFIIQKFVK